MRQQQRSLQGFTLIEILVVLFIISIVTSVALMSISHNESKQLEAFTDELVQTISLAEEQAMLQPVVLGLSMRDKTLQFVTLKNELAAEKKDKWTSFEDHLLNKHAIPDDVHISIDVGQQKVSSNEEVSHPQVIISTNGDLTPFSIYIGKQGSKPSYVITGDADGNVSSHALS